MYAGDKKVSKQDILIEWSDVVLRKVLIVKNTNFQSNLYGIIFSHNPECELFFAAKGLENIDLMDLQIEINLITSNINMPIM